MKPTLTIEQKLEIGRMLREGVSDAGIKVVVQSWLNQPASYATYVEYGYPPMTKAKTVEGTVAPVIDDPTRLIDSP